MNQKHNFLTLVLGLAASLGAAQAGSTANQALKVEVSAQAAPDPGVDVRRYAQAYAHDHFRKSTLACRHAAARVVELARADGHEAVIVVLEVDPRVGSDHAVPAVRIGDRWAVMDWYRVETRSGPVENVRRWWRSELPLDREWYRNRLSDAWLGIQTVRRATEVEYLGWGIERRLRLQTKAGA